MGAIYRGPKTGYILTNEDMVWFARGLGGETWGSATREDAKWHFWSWMDRFHLIKGPWQGPTNVPIAGALGKDLIQWHSQALSPKWANKGSAAQLANRAKWTNRTQAGLESDGMWRYAVEAANGTLERPVDVPLYNFAACNAIKNNQSDRPCSGLSYGGQCFITPDCYKAKYDNPLVLNDDGTVPGPVTLGTSTRSVGMIALGVLFGSAVAWALWTLYGKRKG